MTEKARYYNWMLTIFPQPVIDKNDVFEFWKLKNSGKFNIPKMNYMVFQIEIAPSTEKVHLQCYCEFVEKVSMKWIKEMFEDNTIHCEPRKGSQKQAIDYCTKVDSRATNTFPIFQGIQKCQGNRSDLDSMVDAIEAGMTGDEVLKMFRGNALRHMAMIDRAVSSMHKMNPVDAAIRMMRVNGELNPIT